MSIKHTSSKNIKPLWLSSPNGGPVQQVECEIDSGAECDVMPMYTYKSSFGNKEHLLTPVQIFGHRDSPIANIGACAITIHMGHKQPHTVTCQVTDTRGYLILGRGTA